MYPKIQRRQVSWMFFIQVVRGRSGGRLQYSANSWTCHHVAQGLCNGPVSVPLSLCPVDRPQRWHGVDACCPRAGYVDRQRRAPSSNGASAANADSVTFSAAVAGWIRTCFKGNLWRSEKEERRRDSWNDKIGLAQHQIRTGFKPSNFQNNTTTENNLSCRRLSSENGSVIYKKTQLNSFNL